jgi:hypothetical protein
LKTSQVEPEVLHQIETQGSTTVWVVLEEQADLSAAYQMQDWQARGQYVYENR